MASLVNTRVGMRMGVHDVKEYVLSGWGVTSMAAEWVGDGVVSRRAVVEGVDVWTMSCLVGCGA